jgi:hypothetical protein
MICCGDNRILNGVNAQLCPGGGVIDQEDWRDDYKIYSTEDHHAFAYSDSDGQSVCSVDDDKS